MSRADMGRRIKLTLVSIGLALQPQQIEKWMLNGGNRES
jgi:hypothetical protein